MVGHTRSQHDTWRDSEWKGNETSIIVYTAILTNGRPAAGQGRGPTGTDRWTRSAVYPVMHKPRIQYVWVRKLSVVMRPVELVQIKLQLQSILLQISTEGSYE